jgi:Pyruvate/2-oxoacid:ferredoxin oxidoreductase gamma subunit
MSEPRENREIHLYQDEYLLTLMIEIRIHGRGGQGVVTAAELLASAAFLDLNELELRSQPFAESA